MLFDVVKIYDLYKYANHKFDLPFTFWTSQTAQFATPKLTDARVSPHNAIPTHCAWYHACIHTCSQHCYKLGVDENKSEAVAIASPKQPKNQDSAQPWHTHPRVLLWTCTTHLACPSDHA